MARSPLHDVVVGLDGSPASIAAARWAAAVLSDGGRLHALHVLRPVEELAVDAVLADSVKLRHAPRSSRSRDIGPPPRQTVDGAPRGG